MKDEFTVSKLMVMKYMDHFRKDLLLVVSIVSCLLLGSCSPWESDLENVYQAAQKEDKNAMFAVVRHYDDFKDVVPLDSFERYRQVLIESGNDAIITDAWLQEWADFRKPHPKMSDEEYEDRRNDILFKWAQIGISCSGRFPHGRTILSEGLGKLASR